MSFPFKSVKIGPFDIAVKNFATLEENEANLGTFSHCDHTIYKRDRYANVQQEAEVVLHEILHGIYQTMNVRPRDGEERTVHLMAIGMAMVIRDNPALMKWFMGALNGRT